MPRTRGPRGSFTINAKETQIVNATDKFKVSAVDIKPSVPLRTFEHYAAGFSRYKVKSFKATYRSTAGSSSSGGVYMAFSYGSRVTPNSVQTIMGYSGAVDCPVTGTASTSMSCTERIFNTKGLNNGMEYEAVFYLGRVCADEFAITETQIGQVTFEYTLEFFDTCDINFLGEEPAETVPLDQRKDVPRLEDEASPSGTKMLKLLRALERLTTERPEGGEAPPEE